MKKILKKSLSVILAITIIFSSALVGLNEIDFSGVFAVKAEAAESWLWPVADYTNWTTYDNHRGIDVPAPSGTPIRASKSGTLYVYNNTCNGSHLDASPACTVAGCNSTSGKCVFIIHGDGTASCYMHMVSLAVTYTKWVNQGDIIGYVGTTGPSTGNHLHFEVATGSGTDYWSYSLMNPGNLSYIYSLTVAPTGITANEKQFTMTVGENKTVTATVSPSNANNKNVTWTSSDTSVATVSNGVIKAVSSGGATIKATNSAGHKVYIEVVVNPVNVFSDGMVEHDGHTYEIFHSLMTWKQAKEYCEKQGGHLVTITSKEENDAVFGLIEKYGNEKCEEYFIGMIDEKSDSKYTWITGEEAIYENWDTGEPSNAPYVVCYERYQDYGAILKDGSWDDVNNYANVCASVFGFICEYEKEFTYDNVTIIGDKVYELYEREYPITFANEFAENKGGNLVTITSEEEQTSLIAWIQANSDIKKIAIGASDAENDSVWQWLNGEEWGYAPWDDGEPNDYSDGEDYAVLILGLGKWNDVPGANAYSFVIEYDLEEWLDAGNDANDIIFNELPEGADPDDYEIVTEYRYRDKETKTDTASSLDGWELYDSETTYGSWGSVQSTKTKPTESDTLQITGTWQQYHYYHYCNYYSNGGNNWNVDSIPYGSQSIRHDTYLNQQLPAISFPDQGNKQAYGGTGASVTSACDYNFYIWFYADEATFYNYQTRTKTTTNHFYKYGDWSAWNTTPVVATSNKQVETRTVYKLKDHKHTSSSWIIDKEATVYKAGSKHKECTECGEVLKTATIPQLKCGKPTLKKVTNTEYGVKITWGKVKGADSYKIYRKTKSGDWKYLDSTKNAYFTDKTAKSGTKYYYAVRAKNEAGDSSRSSEKSIFHLAHLTLKKITNSEYGVLIKWNKVNGAEKYNVYRKVKGGSYSKISTTSKTYYTDKKARSGKKYYYIVKAINGSATSVSSSAKSILHLADPTLKKFTNTEYGVKITWGKVTGAEKYNVYRKTSSGSYGKIATTTKTYYTDKKAKSGRKYYYIVKAVKGSATSASSSAKSILHLADPTLKKVTNTEYGVKITWGKVNGAEKYRIYRKTSKNGEWKYLDSTSKNYFTDKSAKSGKTYYYTVLAYNGSARSYYNTTGLKIKFLSTPKISSVKNTSKGIKITWNKISSAKGYIVYRKTGSGDWKQIGKITNYKTVSFTDKKYNNNITYKYTVRAYNGDYKSSYYSDKGKIKAIIKGDITSSNVKTVFSPILKQVSSSDNQYYAVGLVKGKNGMHKDYKGKVPTNLPDYVVLGIYKFKSVNSISELKTFLKKYMTADFIKEYCYFDMLTEYKGSLYVIHGARGSTAYDANSIKLVGRRGNGYYINADSYGSGDNYCYTVTFYVKKVNGRYVVDDIVSKKQIHNWDYMPSNYKPV